MQCYNLLDCIFSISSCSLLCVRCLSCSVQAHGESLCIAGVLAVSRSRRWLWDSMLLVDVTSMWSVQNLWPAICRGSGCN